MKVKTKAFAIVSVLRNVGTCSINAVMQTASHSFPKIDQPGSDRTAIYYNCQLWISQARRASFAPVEPVLCAIASSSSGDILVLSLLGYSVLTSALFCLSGEA